MSATNLLEYRVAWQQCPYCDHDPRVIYIRAQSADDAKALAKNHIERKFGVTWFTVNDAVEAPTVPEGEVLTGPTR